MKKKTQEKEADMQDTPIETTDSKENTKNDETPGTNNHSQKDKEDISLENPNGSEYEETADKIVAEVRAVEEKLAESQDKYLRLSAEFDNYRKRTLKEKMDLSKYAEESLLLKLLPFMDDFERAIQHIEKSDENEALKNGIDLIFMKFSDFLKQNGIKEIEAVNNDFDVDLHEAVAKVQVDETGKKGKVVDVILKGYYLRDKVLRFAKVVVGE